MTAADLLQALEAAMTVSPADDGAITAVELQQAGKMSEERTRRGIRALILTGTVECVKTRRPDVTKRMQVVPGYRMVK